MKPENSKYLIFLIILLIINGYIFSQLFIDRDSDLSIKDVSYIEETGEWQVETAGTHRLPGRKVEVQVVFEDGIVEKESWNLDQDQMTWSYNRDIRIERVMIDAPEELDWDRANSVYLNDLWSKEVELTTIKTKNDISFALGKGGDIFQIYSEPVAEEGTGRIYLEKRDFTGELNWGPELISTSSNGMIKRPFIYLLDDNGDSAEALVGWSIKNDKESDELYRVRIEKDNYSLVDLVAEERVKLYDDYLKRDNQKLYLLAGINSGYDFNWKVFLFKSGRENGSIELPFKPGTVENPAYGRLIPDEEGINVFWLEKEEWSQILYYGKADNDGEVLVPVKEVSKIKVDLTIPESFQIVRVADKGFHMAWIEKGTRQRQMLNYQIMDFKGNVIDRSIDFVSTGGYCPGFDLSLTPDGNLELFYIRLYGHQIFQRQRNTELHKIIFSPEMKLILPQQLVAGSSYYEEYPSLYYSEKGQRYLFWNRDGESGREVFYSTTDPEVKEIVDKSDFYNWISSTLEYGVFNLQYFVTGLLIVLMASVIPLIGLVIFNLLGKYKKEKYLYWLTGLFFIFPLKVYNETIFISWENPLLSRAYIINLILFGLVLLVMNLYWYQSGKKGWKFKTEFYNRLIFFWLILDSFVIYFKYIKDVFIL